MNSKRGAGALEKGKTTARALARKGARRELPRRSIEARIQDHYQRLSPAERQLADLILNFPGELASYSATELAMFAGVSNAAATRLIQRLGYESYEQLRRQARDAQRWGSALYLNPRAEPGGERGPAGSLEAHLHCELANLKHTMEKIDPAEAEEMVAALAAARRVFFVGFRNSYMFAAYARWQLIQVRGDVLLLPTAGETLGEHLAWLGGEDVLFAVGIRRRVPALRKVMEVAREAGARIVYVTDPTASKSARLATWTVRCEVRGGSLFDSYAAVVSVLHYLCSAVVRQTGASGRTWLRGVERLHEDLSEL